MLRQAGTADASGDEVGRGQLDVLRCLTGQREMPESLDPPQRERYAHEYIALRPRLQAHFRKRFPTLRSQESDFYNEAWESLLRQDDVENPRAFLSRAMYARGIDEMRRDARRPHGSADATSPTVKPQP